MIDIIHVKWSAEKALRDKLKNVPAAANYIINNRSRWLRWCELLTQRLRECEEINLIRSRESLQYAIQSWTFTYAARELENSEWKKDNDDPA